MSRQTWRSAYACQDAAIARWPDRVVGWKVGTSSPSAARRFRRRAPARARSSPATCSPPRRRESHDCRCSTAASPRSKPSIVLQLRPMRPRTRPTGRREEAASLSATLHRRRDRRQSAGDDQRLGPRVVVSDFGNNCGPDLGPDIPDWRSIRRGSARPARPSSKASSVGTAAATALPGGPLAAFAFALATLARRGRPLKAGDLHRPPAATTGIHDISPASSARSCFGGFGEIRCRAVRCRAVADAGRRPRMISRRRCCLARAWPPHARRARWRRCRPAPARRRRAHRSRRARQRLPHRRSRALDGRNAGARDRRPPAHSRVSLRPARPRNRYHRPGALRRARHHARELRARSTTLSR